MDFPVSDYYKERILDGMTINRVGPWWSAILLMRDPKNQKKFLTFYLWKKQGREWKNQKRFNCRSQKDAERIIEILTLLSKELD